MRDNADNVIQIKLLLVLGVHKNPNIEVAPSYAHHHPLLDGRRDGGGQIIPGCGGP